MVSHSCNTNNEKPLKTNTIVFHRTDVLPASCGPSINSNPLVKLCQRPHFCMVKVNSCSVTGDYKTELQSLWEWILFWYYFLFQNILFALFHLNRTCEGTGDPQSFKSIYLYNLPEHLRLLKFVRFIFRRKQNTKVNVCA